MAHEFVVLAVMGIDQHENGAIAVSRLLREAQMKVSYLGKLQTPESVVERAIAEDADVIGISCHSWEYLTLVPKLLGELERQGADIPVIIGGSVITPEDAGVMREAGVAGVFASAMDGDGIVDSVRDLAAARRAASDTGSDVS